MYKLIFGIIVGLISIVAFVYAHGSYYGNRQYIREGHNYMHDEIDEIFNTGNFEELENLREEYNMPFLHWVDDQEDFERVKELYEGHEESSYRKLGGCHGWT